MKCHRRQKQKKKHARCELADFLLRANLAVPSASRRSSIIFTLERHRSAEILIKIAQKCKKTTERNTIKITPFAVELSAENHLNICMNFCSTCSLEK